MLEMAQWMDDIRQLLQSRLDADVLSGDVPEEYEVGYHCFIYLVIVLIYCFLTSWLDMFIN